jgi:hypothetical protein
VAESGYHTPRDEQYQMKFGDQEFKPLFAMNIDVGGSVGQKKVYIFEDTVPIQKAYEFVENHGLRNSVVEKIAELIAINKKNYYQSSRKVDTPQFNLQGEVSGAGISKFLAGKKILQSPNPNLVSSRIFATPSKPRNRPTDRPNRIWENSDRSLSKKSSVVSQGPPKRLHDYFSPTTTVNSHVRPSHMRQTQEKHQISGFFLQKRIIEQYLGE